MKTAATLFILLAVGTVFATSTQAAQDKRPPCEDRAAYQTRGYWYVELYYGLEYVEDRKGTRIGRIENQQRTCFSVPLKDLKDTTAHTLGYHGALNELLRYRSISISTGKENPKKIFRQVKKATGLDFKSKKDMQTWWYENRDYLRWSPEENRLQVDETAKAQKTPVSKEYQTIRPGTYWHAHLMGRIRDEVQEGDELRADMWTYHGFQGIRLPVQKLENIPGKEHGYLRAIGEVIEDYIASSSMTDKNRQYYIEQLQEWTGLPYTRPEKWKRWLTKNYRRLVFSPKQNRLVIGK